MTFEEVQELELIIGNEITITFLDDLPQVTRIFADGPWRGYDKPKKQIGDYINTLDGKITAQYEIASIADIEIVI